jgi:hypothetical protein
MNEHDPQASPMHLSSLKARAPRRCPPFSPATLRRDLLWDNSTRWLLAGAVFLLLFSSMLAPAMGDIYDEPAWVTPVILAIVGIWLWLSIANASVARRVGRITALLDEDPDAAEAELAAVMARKPLQRSVRFLLYHRLAILRSRQGRIDEASAICHAVLCHDLGSAESVRTHLLLLLTECRLNLSDPAGAYAAMIQLHQRKLQLLESLQLMALQTRYEVTLGFDAAALAKVGEKIRLSELMPAAQCGAVHAMLALAATRNKRPRLARWLRDRAELLCTPEQLKMLADVWPQSE